MPHYVLSEEASRFIEMCYEMKWMRSFDWGEWVQTPEAISLRDDPVSMEEATHEQMERLLTALIRQDRFVEGSLGEAFESGLLTRIVKRAAVLSELPSVLVSECAAGNRSGSQTVSDAHEEVLRERFDLPEGYSIETAEGPVTCMPPGYTTYEVLTPIDLYIGGKMRLWVEESISQGSSPWEAQYFIHDQGIALDHFPLFGTQLTDGQRSRVNEIVAEYGGCVEFDNRRISVRSNSQEIGVQARKLAEAVRAISEMARAE